MIHRHVLLSITVIVVWVSLLSGCSSTTRQTPADNLDHSLSLTAPETSKAVAAEDIESFMVTLRYNGSTDTEVNVSLETSQGASWKAALCYDDYCFIHNGQDKLVRTLPVAAREKKELEVKVFVPKTARTGEAKRLKLAAATVTNRGIPTSVELEGFIP
jgi:uncharacterized membrane protein